MIRICPNLNRVSKACSVMTMCRVLYGSYWHWQKVVVLFFCLSTTLLGVGVAYIPVVLLFCKVDTVCPDNTPCYCNVAMELVLSALISKHQFFILTSRTIDWEEQATLSLMLLFLVSVYTFICTGCWKDIPLGFGLSKLWSYAMWPFLSLTSQSGHRTGPWKRIDICSYLSW